MGFSNRKSVFIVYAILAALMLLTFQNCSKNLFTVATVVPAVAREKEVHSVDKLIRTSAQEIQITKNKMAGKHFPRRHKVLKGQKVTKNTMAKSSTKPSLKIKKRPPRESASVGDMKIYLKKIKPKKKIKKAQ